MDLRDSVNEHLKKKKDTDSATGASEDKTNQQPTTVGSDSKNKEEKVDMGTEEKRHRTLDRTRYNASYKNHGRRDDNTEHLNTRGDSSKG